MPATSAGMTARALLKRKARRAKKKRGAEDVDQISADI
jgi:hypothetical protein